MDKGSSITPADLALLDKPSLIQAACCVCGDPAGAKHHAPPRSRIPKAMHKRIPLLSVCGHGNESGCHRLLHGFVTPSYDDLLGWRFTVTDDDAYAEISARRMGNGFDELTAAEFSPIYSGPADVTDTNADELTFELWQQIERMSAEETSIEWMMAVRLLDIRAALREMFGASGGRSAFREQYQERGYSATRVSRLTAWAETLACCLGGAALGVTKGYNAARAVQLGKLTPQEAVDAASSMSASDFASEYLDAGEREPTIYKCPKCGTEGVSADFKGE